VVSTRRLYDVVLYGATGFVGRQTVAYFARHAGRRVRWAIAGRNEARLREVRDAAGAGAAGAGLIVADAGDAAALAALAAQAKVVLSTAGPFALYGSGLVAACVAQHPRADPGAFAARPRYHRGAAGQPRPDGRGDLR